MSGQLTGKCGQQRMIGVFSIGDLIRERTYRVHSRFENVANFAGYGRLVTLARPGTDAGPLTIVMNGFDPGRVKELKVERNAAVLDGLRVPFEDDKIYESSIEPLCSPRCEFSRNLGRFGSYLYLLAPDESLKYLLYPSRNDPEDPSSQRQMRQHIRNCVRDILYWERRRGVVRLKGCGVGLTPSGDDFIVGVLIGLHVLEHLGVGNWQFTREGIYTWATRGDLLVDTFLYLAEEGLVIESIKGLIRALDRGNEEKILAWTRRIVAIGATSGADTAVGLYMTVREGLLGRLRGCPRYAPEEQTVHAAGEGWWS